MVRSFLALCPGVCPLKKAPSDGPFARVAYGPPEAPVQGSRNAIQSNSVQRLGMCFITV